MKLYWWAGVLPLFALLMVSVGCSKTNDLSNKTAVTVSCERVSEINGESQMGTEVVIRHEPDDMEHIQFTLVPSSVTFENLEPGTYRVWGMNSSSLDTQYVTVAQNQRAIVVLKYP